MGKTETGGKGKGIRGIGANEQRRYEGMGERGCDKGKVGGRGKGGKVGELEWWEGDRG
jgi:hypothetical protein